VVLFLLLLLLAMNVFGSGIVGLAMADEDETCAGETAQDVAARWQAAQRGVERFEPLGFQRFSWSAMANGETTVMRGRNRCGPSPQR
jgi:hypothetical protein